MPDEFQSWERAQRPTERRGSFTPKVSAVKFAGHAPRENRYRREAERDRIIFRWLMSAVLIVALLLGIVFWNVLAAG